MCDMRCAMRRFRRAGSVAREERTRDKRRREEDVGFLSSASASASVGFRASITFDSRTPRISISNRRVRAHPGVERQRGARRTDGRREGRKDDDRGCRSGSRRRRRRRTTPDDDAWDGARGDARVRGDDGGGERGAKESRTLERFGRRLGVVRAATRGGPRARPAPRAGKGSGRARAKVFAG